MAQPLWRLTEEGAVVDSAGRASLTPLKTSEPIVLSPHGDGRFILREWAIYRLKCEQAEQVWCGDDPISPVDDGLFLVSYENAVGLSQIQVHLRDGEMLRLGTEVVSRKLVLDNPDHALYQPTFLQLLIEGIAKHLADGAFDALAPTAYRVEEDSSTASDIFLFHFLRLHAEDLAQAVRTVLANPYRVLERREEIRPVGQARRVEASGIAWSLGKAQWARSPSVGVFTAADGTRYAPTAILATLAEESFDTPENRFVLSFVWQLTDALVGAHALLAKRPEPAFVAALKELEDDLAVLLADERFASLPESRLLPTHSQVLLHREGYEALYKLFPSFLAGRRALQGLLGDMIALRDIAHLYEIWCFLEVARVLGVQLELGPPRLVLRSSPVNGTRLQAHATFFGSALNLVYQRSFPGRGRPADGRSYSVEFVPDITLQEGRRAVGVFDAKFRLRWSQVDPEAGPDGKPVEEDLHKMHAYRDALHLRFAAAVYPGDRNVFYPDDGLSRASPTTLADLVADHSRRGIGAFSLRPGGK